MRAEWHAGIGQHSTGRFHFRRQFVRVIEMQVHIHRVIFLHDRAEFRSDPFRQRARYPGAEANQFQVRDGAQGFEYAL